MADLYGGKVLSIKKSGGELIVECQLKKENLHTHIAAVVFRDDPREKDAFLSKYLKKGEKIQVLFG